MFLLDLLLTFFTTLSKRKLTGFGAFHPTLNRTMKIHSISRPTSVSQRLGVVVALATALPLLLHAENPQAKESGISGLFVREIPIGMQVSPKVAIDDKNPFVPAPEPHGWFGGVEATFFKPTRADGMRYEDSSQDSVDTDYSFTPRYTLGYRTGANSGIRARYWGNFHDTSFSHAPTAAPQGRVFSEASTLDVEVFRGIDLHGYEIEVSAGLQHVNFYEGLFDAGDTFPESSKDVHGWGPVVGIELRKDLRRNTQFYAKARHSLLMTDATVWESSGPAYLNESNGGITEIGLGLRHNRVIGNSLVTFHGGYEWQQWHNFSYGFEDSNSDDDIAGPADAGFHGFVLGVEITGRGADPLHGKYGYGSGDFGLGDDAQGWFGGFEATFFQYNRADGLRTDVAPNETVSSEHEFTPRYTLGYQGANGSGIRARYWGDFEQRALPQYPPSLAAGEGLVVDASTIDVEFFDTFKLRDYDLEMSIGVQSANFSEFLINDTTPDFGELKSTTGWGPVIGARLSREIGNSTNAFIKARHSLLMTDSVARDDTGTPAYLDGANGGITEIGLGVEHSREIGNAAVTLKAGYEWQRWHNFATTFEDSNASDDPSGPGDAGFNGFVVGVEISGQDPAEPYSIGAKAGKNPKGVHYADTDPGLFYGTESTFFKFGRADGMRTEDDPDDSARPRYEFAPRFTLGYLTRSGLGFRAKYWGSYDQRHLPHDPGSGDALDVDASLLDLEVFDTFTIGKTDLELSAGLQHVDYYEAIYDANASAPESSKAVNGWGPVIGAEVRRPFFWDTHVTAKASHSLLLTDAVIGESSGPAYLNGSNAGITELGFGLEKEFIIRGADVTVKGGYEWQRWHNVSYGFEDTNNSDDVSGPADASFRGFTIGVEVKH